MLDILAIASGVILTSLFIGLSWVDAHMGRTR